MFGLFKEKKNPQLVGIDLGSHTIKALLLSKRGPQVQIDAALETLTPKGVMVESQLQDIERAGQALSQLKRQLPSHCRAVATAVTGANVISKVISVPPDIKTQDLSSYVLHEAEQLIPFPLDEVSLDFEPLPQLASNGNQAVLLSAARTESVNGRVSALNEAEFHTEIVDVGVHALARAVLACEPKLASANLPVALLDLGATSLTFAALEKGEVIYSRVQNFGAEQYDQALMQALGVSREEAEQIKHSGQLTSEQQSLLLVPYLTHVLQQMRRQVQLFTSSTGKKELACVVLSGGGSLLPGLLPQARQEFACEVLQPDPLALFAANAADKTALAHAGKHGSKYMTAFGLALRSFCPCPR
ncbi:MAG: type IV pilus assembly protein PilM [Aeromonas sp.]